MEGQSLERLNPNLLAQGVLLPLATSGIRLSVCKQAIEHQAHEDEVEQLQPGCQAHRAQSRASGMKWSGIGYRFGRWGLETYAALQVIELNRT